MSISGDPASVTASELRRWARSRLIRRALPAAILAERGLDLGDLSSVKYLLRWSVNLKSPLRKTLEKLAAWFS